MSYIYITKFITYTCLHHLKLESNNVCTPSASKLRKKRLNQQHGCIMLHIYSDSVLYSQHFPNVLKKSIYVPLSLSLVHVHCPLALNLGNRRRAGLGKVEACTSTVHQEHTCEGFGSCQESPWRWEGYVGWDLLYSCTGPSCMRISTNQYL